MSTLSKETTEALSIPAVESAASGTVAQPAAPTVQHHSDAVSLEVPLKVHGSKVSEAARGAASHPEPFEEETGSMIVFPHGGVVRMTTSVNAGQMLILTNLKSRQDAICRVIKVRSYSNSSSYVEVEFTHRQPGFWGVYFESDALPAPPASPAGLAESAAKSSKQSGPPGLSKTSQEGKESSFIGIGSQEEVQPSASSTGVSTSSKSRTPGQDAKSFQKSVPVSPAQAGRSRQQEQDDSAASETSASTEISAEPFDAAASLRSAAKARVLSGDESAEGTEGKKNWLLIGAGVAALLVASAGVLFFSLHKSADAPLPQAPRSQAQSSQSQFSQNPSLPYSNPATAITQPQTRPAPSLPPAIAPPPITSHSTIVGKSPKENVVITEAPVDVETTAAAAPAPKKSVPSVYSALNSRPVAQRLRSEGVAAPRLDALSAPTADPLAGIASSSAPSAPPVSNLRVTAPVQTFTGPKEPRLLVRVIPQYPAMARQTHTEGDVVLNVSIDPSGNVTDAKVVSGPTILHMAAVGAVKRWKYEPLDGQTGTVKLAVTIQFRL